MLTFRRASLWTAAVIVTIAAAYALGVQIGEYFQERREAELVEKAVPTSRAIIRHLGTPDVGSSLPDVVLEDIDGRRHQLSSLVTGDALVSFIQTDCEACLTELDEIAAVCRDTADWSRFVFISSANPLHLRTLRDNFRIKSVFLFDEDRAMGAGLKITAFPLSFLVDNSLKVLDVHAGVPPIEAIQRLVKTD